LQYSAAIAAQTHFRSPTFFAAAAAPLPCTFSMAKKATKTITKTTTKGKGQQKPQALYRSSWAGKHWGVRFEWFLSSVKLRNGIVTELWKGWAWGAGEGGKDVEGHQGQQGHEGDEGQEVSGAAWRRSNEGHEGPLERRPKRERSVCASLLSQFSGPPLIADKMFSENVARVCCLAPAIDRFDCMFMTNCAWLAMLSLVYMALLTLAAIRYNEYSLSGNSLHRCHACDVQVDVLLALEFLSSNIVCVRHGGRHSTCEAGSQRRCPTEVLT
jgi:hypothetical protein